MVLMVILLIGLLTASVSVALSVNATKRSRMFTAPQEQDPSVDFACDALVTRVFEQRMVDAGILTVAEMTTCDSPACKDCLPTRRSTDIKIAASSEHIRGMERLRKKEQARKELVQQLREDARDRPKRANPGYL